MKWCKVKIEFNMKFDNENRDLNKKIVKSYIKDAFLWFVRTYLFKIKNLEVIEVKEIK